MPRRIYELIQRTLALDSDSGHTSVVELGEDEIILDCIDASQKLHPLGQNYNILDIGRKRRLRIHNIAKKLETW